MRTTYHTHSETYSPPTRNPKLASEEWIAIVNSTMIVKNNSVCNAQATATTIHSPSLPHRNLVASGIISNSKVNLVKDCDDSNVDGDRCSIGLANFQMRLIASLVFAFIPGLTQVPFLASSTVLTVPTIAQAPATAAVSPSSIDPEDLLDRRRSMDAARLLLDDYSGKRGKIPTSLKKQIDMQDRRLAICQDMTRDEWEWEQCFYYGTNSGGGGGGAMYFGDGVFDENNPVTKTTAKSPKQKIPTW